LQTLGFIEKIHQANNGQQALDMVMENEISFSKGKSRFYDLIFLDLGMPIKDGYQACELILQHYNQVGQDRPVVSNQENKDNWLLNLKQVFMAY